MKSARWMTILLIPILIVALVLGACAAPAEKPAPAPTPAPKPTPAPVPKPTPPEVFELKFQTFESPTDAVRNQSFWVFAERVEERSEGRLKLKLLDVGAVVGILEMLYACSAGVLDGIYTPSAYYTSKIPTGAVDYGLPYSWADPFEATTVMYERGLIDVVRKDWAKENVHFIGQVNTTYLVWYVKEKPLKVVDDFVGLKVRALGAIQYAPKELGASIVVVPYPELYTALSQGVIDAVVTAGDALITLGLSEVVDYVMHPPVAKAPIAIGMNTDVWNKLPTDLQELIYDEVPRLSMESYIRTEYETDRQLEKAAAMGVKLEYMSPELVEELARITRTEGWDWVAGLSPLAAEAVEIVRNYMIEQGRKVE